MESPTGGDGVASEQPSMTDQHTSSVTAATSIEPALPEQPKVRGRKGGRSQSPVVLDAVTQAALAQAAQQCQVLGCKGIATLLTSSSSTSSTIPTVEQVRTAAYKALSESPPWIHWSKTDMAPQLRCIDPPLMLGTLSSASTSSTTSSTPSAATTARLTLTAATMRGYRMARASHGVSVTNNHQAAYYFECKLLPGPSALEIAQSLPPNARLGPHLRKSLQKALLWEEQQQEEKKSETSTEETTTGDEARGRKHKLAASQDNEQKKRPKVGGHVRLGWSMRTGDLQAPVGYDKWSYGIRDRGGSSIHQSNRQDSWEGQMLDEGDVVGCAIVLDPTDSSQNHIRFFKNGKCMGEFVISKGKRVGGEAFVGIQNGLYYPAVSTYMGGTVRSNFGPHFVYPPRKLPAGLRLKPLSDLCPPPMSPEDAVTKMSGTTKLFRKPEQAQALIEAVQTEASILCRAHECFVQTQLEYVRQERLERGIAVQDLPSPPPGAAAAAAAAANDS